MALDEKSLKKMFPNLYRELVDGDNKVSIDSVRKNPEEAEATCKCECDDCGSESEVSGTSIDMPDKFRHFNPEAVDFIRRCDTEDQAEEIITYLQKKGEISDEYAELLRCQLKRDGVRSFGSKKEDYHYFREGGIF
jgi:hypothetical protein